MMDPRRAEAIGRGFVNQYYHIIESSPGDLYRYYHPWSVVTRPNRHDVMETVTTIEAIHDMLMSWSNGCKVEVKSTDIQTAHTGGILVLVTGCSVGKDNIQKKFAQSFFLAPQNNTGGYFVQNDVLRFVDEGKSVEVGCELASGIRNSAVKSVQNDSTMIVKQKIKNRNASERRDKHTDRKDASGLVEKTPSKVDAINEGQNNAMAVVDKIDQNASECSNTRNGRKDGSMLKKSRTRKRVVDAECEDKNNVTFVAEENINTTKCTYVHTDLQGGSLLVNNPSLEGNSTLGLKDKLVENRQASEISNVQDDHGDGSLAEKPLLKRDMEGVQKNATVLVKENPNCSVDSTMDTDIRNGLLLIENPAVEKYVVVESPRHNATSEVKKKKKRKSKKENLVATDCSNTDTELKEGSVLVENPSALQQTDPPKSSLLVENPSFQRDADIETEPHNSKTEVKNKKKRKKENLVASACSNVVTELKEGSALVENPNLKQEVRVENIQTDVTLGVEEENKENPIASEDVNIQTDVQNDSLLAGNSSLERACDVEIEKCNAATEVKKKKKRKRERTEVADDSAVGENLFLQTDTVLDSVQENVTSEGKRKKKRKKAQNRIENVDTDLKTVSLLDESPEVLVEHADTAVMLEDSRLEIEMERGQDNSTFEVKKKKKRKKVENVIKNEATDLTLLDESPHLDTDVHVENEHADATAEVKKKTERKKHEELNRLEVSSIGTDLEEDPLPVVTISSLTRDLTVKTAEYREELVCDKPKKKKKKDKRLDTSEEGNAQIVAENVPLAMENPPLESVSSLQPPLGRSKIDKELLDSAIPVDTVDIKNPVPDTSCVEESTGDLSGCGPLLKLLEPNNTPVENIEDSKSSSSIHKLEDVTALDTEDNRYPPQLSDSSPERSLLNPTRKLIILDVNGLLADIVLNPSHGIKPDLILSGKQVFKRPFCDNFLQFLLEKFDVGVWSSRVKKNVDRVTSFLMGKLMNRLLFCWDQSHCTHTGLKTVDNNDKPLVLKELKKLWEKQEPGLPWEKGQYNESNTLLIDDSPYKALRNPVHTAIFPKPYRHDDRIDDSLGPGGDLRLYLEELAIADNVQEYVKQNPFGQKPITETDISWEFYSKIQCGDSEDPAVLEAESPAATICSIVNG